MDITSAARAGPLPQPHHSIMSLFTDIFPSTQRSFGETDKVGGRSCNYEILLSENKVLQSVLLKTEQEGKMGRENKTEA